MQKYSSLPIWTRNFATAATLNPKLLDEYRKAAAAPDTHRTHFFAGRFENTYVEETRLPSLAALGDWLLREVQAITGESSERLSYSFWFNEMRPGDITERHHHEEDGELLSAVYYLSVPPTSGRLILYHEQQTVEITPEEGLCVLFSPGLEHEVERNDSTRTRLSIAFNFGVHEDQE